MSLHATLSPSSAERWISCPASIRMTELMPEEQESVYALEGTAAHALAELLARELILGTVTPTKKNSELKKWRAKFHIEDDAEAEMTEYALGYVGYLQIRMAEQEGSVLMLEQRLDTGVPHSWGTSDAIIVSPDVVESVDYKYGLGVRVEAVGNPQLRLYAVGALDTFGKTAKNVRCTVYQPRLSHIAWEEISAEALRGWRDSLLPIAEVALGPDAPFGPSEDACRWCPASGSCVAQMEWVNARDFGVKADVMSAEELAKALDDIPAIRAWCSAVENLALDLVYSKGKTVPGYKVVLSGGKRSVTDPDGLLAAALAMGYEEEDITATKVKGIGELEKVLKKDFPIVAGPFVTKGKGSPSLVRDDDGRADVKPESSAVEDFA